MSEQYWDIEETIKEIVHYINNQGGWTVVGWYKRGLISDRTLLDTNTSTSASSVPNNTTEDLQVAAGQICLHVVQLLPTNRDFLDETTTLGKELKDKKYDVSKLVNQA